MQMAANVKGIFTGHILIKLNSLNFCHMIRVTGKASKAILSSFQHIRLSSQWKYNKVSDITSRYWFWKNSKTFSLYRSNFCYVSHQMLSTIEEKETTIQFKESTVCLIFDQTDILISQTTFKDAKALAKTNNSRLVYLNKNKDGLSCFKLQPLTISPTRFPPKFPTAQTPPTHKKHLNEDPTKVFKIKSSIKDHDLNIKIAKIKTLLTKGSLVKVIIQHRQNEVEKVKLDLSNKLTEELTSVSKIRQDTSNKGTTQFSLMPLEQNLQKN
ncbi:unnamed protein product [Lymnaea stagnalis]|uniref:Translation initiation factor IF-3 n=1 Tax=Lymnaea stagnalis TaxID=6523 RepID=A0AAV2GZH0_LYMST